MELRHIPLEYYQRQLRKGEDISVLSSQKILSFWQHILLVASSIDGILISLHETSLQSQYIRLVFLLSIVLLTLAVLTTTIVVYDHSMQTERARQRFAEEEQNAFQEDRLMKIVFVKKKTRTIILEWFSSIALILALLLLLAYTVLKEYPSIIEKSLI